MRSERMRTLGGVVTALVRSLVRPDGRCLVRPHGAWTASAAAEAVSLANELDLPALAHLDGEAVQERAFLARAGFAVSRREARVVIGFATALDALATARLPAGVVARSAVDVDADLLRLLDDALRNDVPGTSGWRSSPDGFRADTFEDPAFDPRTYLVADGSGRYLGLVRAWMNVEEPRLGLLGVRRGHRRRGIALGLLRRALAAVQDTGATEIGAELDVANRASRAIAERLGARRVGATIELVYEPAASRERPLARGKELSRVG